MSVLKNGAQSGGRKKRGIAVLCLVLAAVLLGAVMLYSYLRGQAYTASTFAMDTMVNQTAYGPAARRAMREVNEALAQMETRLSLYSAAGDIGRINAAAGEAVEVSEETAELLRRALALSAQSEGAFAVTIAPITLAWGVTSGTPRVPASEEIAALLPLVDDAAVEVEGSRVRLPQTGMALELGGLAKGEACRVAAQIYEENGVDSALISLGGSSIYARGTKPDGSAYRVGFMDPYIGGSAYLASFALQDEVVATSGGYERYFEVEGERYIHIFDPQTGYPAESDVVSVAVFHKDGMTADFYSTTLFVWGLERSLRYMEAGGKAILLGSDDVLYVSESLRDSLRLHESAEGAYAVTYVPGG